RSQKPFLELHLSRNPRPEAQPRVLMPYRSSWRVVEASFYYQDGFPSRPSLHTDDPSGVFGVWPGCPTLDSTNYRRNLSRKCTSEPKTARLIPAPQNIFLNECSRHTVNGLQHLSRLS